MLVRKAERIDMECIVRGYLSGSAWKEYEATGKVAGLELPRGLGPNARLDLPMFTPSTKSDEGHDRNITISEMSQILGAALGRELVARSLRLFEEARRIAEPKGITIVDTKFEFGYVAGELVLIDEAFTPDSSRFLVREQGASQPINLDKQFIRDYLESTGWDKSPPAPELPPEIVTEARRRYLVILNRLMGGRPSWAE
jgi:phosphoribosylaminoimidazole-succinocarboxamide synthase